MEGYRRVGKKLISGIRLIMLYPQIAFRDCEDCKQWVYDEEMGEREKKGGEYVPRYKGVKPPCGYSQGCVKGSPENSSALNEQNTQALQFIRECKAVGSFPNDPIVRQNAALIEMAEKSVSDAKQQELTDYIKALVQMAIR